MEHDIDDQFILFPQQDAVGYTGEYDAKVIVRVYYPEDFSYSKLDFYTFEENWNLEIVDPCSSSEMADFTILDDQVRVFKGLKIQQLLVPQDTVSQKYGPADGVSFCGPRIYNFLIPTK